MTLNVFNNPASPFVGPIQGGLRHGLQILVSGTPEGSDDRFVINFACGGGGNDDIAFHFNPRFNQNEVVRNTRKGGQWGPEEKHGSFPFQKNSRCDILFLVMPGNFRVSVNGQHFCDYNHRLPVERVTCITTSRGVRLDLIRVDLPPVYPGEGQLAPMYNPPMPFKQKIGSLYPGRMIFVSGIPLPNANRFTVNFVYDGDIAFHFDVRFQHGSDRCSLVRNSLKGNVWGAEERDKPCFPFQQDKYFDMIILVDHNYYKVAVNNKHLLTYNHRAQPLERIDTLTVGGDLRLCHVRFQ